MCCSPEVFDPCRLIGFRVAPRKGVAAPVVYTFDPESTPEDPSRAGSLCSVVVRVLDSANGEGAGVAERVDWRRKRKVSRQAARRQARRKLIIFASAVPICDFTLLWLSLKQLWVRKFLEWEPTESAAGQLRGDQLMFSFEVGPLGFVTIVREQLVV